MSVQNRYYKPVFFKVVLVFKELSIKNFQSHKKTVIEFSNGVNVLVGGSDQGKSAIIRAILWAVNNRPLGADDIVSHWARDDKNKINDIMSVRIITDIGRVTRRKTADTNEYILVGEDDNKKVFSAINKDVPEDIQKFFKLTDTNIQQQHDAPFLLSASASDVAKYFNKIVRLDVIDKVLGNAESARRDTNKKIKETETEKKELEKQLENYEWIEQAQELSDKLLKLNERINELDDGWQVIDCEVKDYQIQKNFLKDFPDIKKAKEIIEKIESIKIDYDLVNETEKDIETYKKLNRDRKIYDMIKDGKDILNEIEIVEEEIERLDMVIKLAKKEIDEYNENKKLSDMGFDKKEALRIIKDIEAIQPDYALLRELNTQIQEYNLALDVRENMSEEIKKYKEELPDVCPECGQPIEECKE